MSIHITSDDFNKQIQKIEPNKTYKIIDRKSIKTRYGNKIILVDSNDNVYWSPSNMIKMFIKYKDLKQFNLTTKDLKTYKSNNGNEYQAPEFVIDA